MHLFNRKFLLACAGVLLCGSVLAQPGPGAGGGMGPGMMGPGAGCISKTIIEFLLYLITTINSFTQFHHLFVSIII